MSSDQRGRAAAERLGNQKSANEQQEREEEMTITTPMRRVLTVQIRNEEEATQKSVLEIVEKVFVSVLETSEIRAYDVTVTKENDKITYTYKAPAPSFPFVPKSIGRLSETGVCEVTEVVVCDYEKNKLENFCETKGMLFADMFVVESFVRLEKISGNSRAVVCVVDVRLRWLKRLDTQRWMEGLVTKATEMKIRKKYEILMKRVASELSATAKMTRNDLRNDLEFILRQNVNYLFCVLVSTLIFCLGFCLGGIDSSLSALWKI
jgi:hypothetical protein